MKILFLAEQYSGGGAISNKNLALASSSFADVAFFGIDYMFEENSNINVFSSKARRPISLKYCFDCWRFMQGVKPDIVHATGMYTGLIALIFRLFKRKKYKIIITLRHTLNKFRLHFISSKLVRILNRVDIIHYLTEYQRRYYSDFGLSPGKYVIIPNIIHSKSYSSEETSKLRKTLLEKASSDTIIGYVGRLIESKQLKTFIEAIETINNSGFNVAGVIVGEGEKRYVESLKNHAEEIGLASKLVFNGFSSNPELYIKACDFGLFPTLTEALPRFIIESFAQQKTLVVSNSPSISSIVTHNYNALVVKDHTPVDYAEECIRLIAEPSLLKDIESGAAATYKELYDPDFVIQEYRNIYSHMTE